jgi:hypothetical protein
MPALVASQTGVAVTDGDGKILDAGWARGAGQAIGWADSAAEAVMLSCSPARRSWSATCRASGSARRRPGSGAAAGRSAPRRRMPIRPRLAGVQFLRLAELSGWR